MSLKTDHDHTVPTLCRIHVAPQAQSLSYLADRWTAVESIVHGHHERAAAWGLTKEVVARYADDIRLTWRILSGYLVVHCPSDKLFLQSELNLPKHCLPERPLTAATDPQSTKAWRGTLQSYAPLMVELRRSIDLITDPIARDITVAFDTSPTSGGAITLLTPLEGIHLYKQVNEMLARCSEAPAFSAHAQLEALSQIHWVLDPQQICASAVPTQNQSNTL